MTRTTDTWDAILAYEQGELEDTEIFELFQYLIDADLIGRLQGSYARMGEYLIARGHCHRKDAGPMAILLSFPSPLTTATGRDSHGTPQDSQ